MFYDPSTKLFRNIFRNVIKYNTWSFEIKTLSSLGQYLPAAALCLADSLGYCYLFPRRLIGHDTRAAVKLCRPCSRIPERGQQLKHLSATDCTRAARKTKQSSARHDFAKTRQLMQHCATMKCFFLAYQALHELFRIINIFWKAKCQSKKKRSHFKFLTFVLLRLYFNQFVGELCNFANKSALHNCQLADLEKSHRMLLFARVFYTRM